MIISPSFLTCDFSDLKSELNQIKDHVEYIHIDVMDGNFVSQITFGHKLIKDLRPHYTNVFDCHLMISDPIKHIESFAEAGCDIITFHFETVDNVDECIEEVKKYNKKVGLSINPDTSIESIIPYLSKIDVVLVMSVYPGLGGQKFISDSVRKIELLNVIKKENNFNYLIEVDGGINDSTISLVKKAGVDIVVSGSYIMNSPDKLEKINILKKE
ncbi:MAG: ribulose-phosphate 3-epimerase [Anaeroplasmataceae bacterium]